MEVEGCFPLPTACAWGLSPELLGEASDLGRSMVAREGYGCKVLGGLCCKSLCGKGGVLLSLLPPSSLPQDPVGHAKHMSMPKLQVS